MSSELPAPLVPPDVDLRGYEFMPYYGDRLRDSDLNSRATDAEYRAAHNLWWSSWKQVPAASLPDDDTVLARLADLGRDVKSWQKVREVALRGFVKCSDGRFYHRVLAPLAIEAFEFRNKQRDRTEKARQARSLLRLSQTPNDRDKSSVTESTGQDRTGQDGRSATRAPPPAQTQAQKPGAGQIAAWLKSHGLIGGNAANPKVIALAEEGVTEQQIIEAVRVARIDRGKGDKPFHFAYVLGILTDIRHPPERKNSGNWRSSDQAIEAKGREVGLVPNRGESYATFADRIATKIAEVSRESAGARS